MLHTQLYTTSPAPEKDKAIAKAIFFLAQQAILSGANERQIRDFIKPLETHVCRKATASLVNDNWFLSASFHNCTAVHRYFITANENDWRLKKCRSGTDSTSDSV